MRARERSAAVMTPRIAQLLSKAIVRATQPVEAALGTEYPPEQTLWIAVVLDAVKCAATQRASKSVNFFASDYFDTVCTLAGLDSDYARQLIRAAIGYASRDQRALHELARKGD